jgi:hypothetical protein
MPRKEREKQEKKTEGEEKREKRKKGYWVTHIAMTNWFR